jgi:hypothetical protein
MDDFARLRENGRVHPLMQKIEAMFQNPRDASDGCRTGIFQAFSRLFVR